MSKKSFFIGFLTGVAIGIGAAEVWRLWRQQHGEPIAGPAPSPDLAVAGQGGEAVAGQAANAGIVAASAAAPVPESTAADTNPPSYQTASLDEYRREFRERAEELFRRVKHQAPPGKTKRWKGSYSILANAGNVTRGKIVIYEKTKGRMNGDWRPMEDGLYVLVRADDEASERIWQALRSDFPHLGNRFHREVTLGVAPKHHERFAYSRVLPADDPADFAGLLALCSRL